MTASLPKYQSANILVLGDIMLDRYWSGSTTRVSPEAPVPIVKVTDIEDRLGGAANVARNLAALGCQVTLCGIIGSDEAGASIAALLRENEISNQIITDSLSPTITKLRILSRHQQLLRVDFEETLNCASQERLHESFEAELIGKDAVIISDYAKGTVQAPDRLIALCRHHHIPVFVDPKGKDFSRYKGATFITPNRAEFELEVGKCQTLEETFLRAEHLRTHIDCEGILVTLGEKGMALASKDGKPSFTATAAKNVFDVTGAGDTVIAVLAASYAAGTGIKDSMRLANLAAGLVVGKLGTSTVSREELQAALHQEDNSLTKGVLPFEALIEQLNASRQKGERIVFTNGCFDILHAGHVRYLEQAAELGDRLIVAINSDESIHRIKGPQRPILSLAQRMEVMASMRCVDWVTPFDDDTPLNLITQLAPDVLVKGGDYLEEEIVGYEIVRKNGGETKIIPFVDGISTTAIVDKIQSLT